MINVPFMVLFMLIYEVFGGILSVTAFFARIYTIDLTISFTDALKVLALCLLELTVLRFGLAWVRATALIGYRKRKHMWGKIERKKIDF